MKCEYPCECDTCSLHSPKPTCDKQGLSITRCSGNLLLKVARCMYSKLIYSFFSNFNLTSILNQLLFTSCMNWFHSALNHLKNQCFFFLKKVNHAGVSDLKHQSVTTFALP